MLWEKNSCSDLSKHPAPMQTFILPQRVMLFFANISISFMFPGARLLSAIWFFPFSLRLQSLFIAVSSFVWFVGQMLLALGVSFLDLNFTKCTLKYAYFIVSGTELSTVLKDIIYWSTKTPHLEFYPEIWSPRID